MSYLINCDLSVERVDDKVYARVRKQTDKWESIPLSEFPESYCGNIHSDLFFDKKKAAFVYSEKDYLEAIKDENLLSNYEVMPSALWLYRLLCHFKAEVYSEGPEGYKLVWQIGLRHKATGEILIFREWKGGFSLGHDGRGRVKNGSFEKDMLALLSELASPDCPHPYDGTVAGSIA